MSTVATVSPPMIANAIGPQNTVGAIGIIPSVAAAAVSRMGRVRWIAGSHHRVPHMLPGLNLPPNLVDKDNRIARDHPDQRQHAENRNETQRRLRQQQCRYDPNKSERCHAQH